YEGFDSNRFHFDFFLLGVGPGRYADAVSQRGCKLHEGNSGGASIPQMARTLRRVVKQGNYDFVHIHQDVMGGIFAVALMGLPVRIIIQAHNCWQRLPVGGRVKETVLSAAGRGLAQWRANALVGVSCQALARMTSGRARRCRIDRVIYCSAKVPCDAPSPTARITAAAAIRRRYELPKSAIVLLFLGRLDDYKNPVQAVKLLGEMIAGGAENIVLLVAGVGGLDTTLQRMAAEQNLESHLRLVGWAVDPGSLLLGADLLVMPSQEICGEGLGLAAVEAQALGTPVLCSLSVPEDATVIPALFRRISLNEEIGNWSRMAHELLGQNRADVMACWSAFLKSPFTDKASYSALSTLYADLAEMDNGPGVRSH
ncbi:MAG: glycosyltransferase, partial [Verrucomicrobiaceae bacterium]